MSSEANRTTIARGIAANLDDAIAALTALDGPRLEALVHEMAATLASGDWKALLEQNKKTRDVELNEVAARHRLLGRLLESTGLNLNVLLGLHRRNQIGETPWVR